MSVFQCLQLRIDTIIYIHICKEVVAYYGVKPRFCILHIMLINIAPGYQQSEFHRTQQVIYKCHFKTFSKTKIYFKIKNIGFYIDARGRVQQGKLLSLMSCDLKYFIFCFLTNPDVEIKFLCCLLKDEKLQQHYKAV